MNEEDTRAHLEEMYEEAGLVISGTEDKAKREWVEFHIQQILSTGGGEWNDEIASTYLNDLQHTHRNSTPLI